MEQQLIAKQFGIVVPMPCRGGAKKFELSDGRTIYITLHRIDGVLMYTEFRVVMTTNSTTIFIDADNAMSSEHNRRVSKYDTRQCQVTNITIEGPFQLERSFQHGYDNNSIVSELGEEHKVPSEILENIQKFLVFMEKYSISHFEATEGRLF